MSANERRVEALRDFGFTERQARFLVLVMRLAGVCVPRQYARFAGVAYGAKCNAFFDKLERRGFAVASACVHNRARLYHVRHKALYIAIGEATSRYRRRVSPRLAVQRLMLLDATLTMPDVDWRTSAAEKAALLAELNATAAGLPANNGTERRTSPAPIDIAATHPVGMAPDGRVVLLYLATEPMPDTFRSVLQSHLPLVRAAPIWTLRIVFPRPLDRFYDAYQRVVHEELESPLHPATISELRWYFEHRQKAAAGPVHPLTLRLLESGAKLFGTPRFTQMYRRWLKHGERVFDGAESAVLAEALNAGRGRIESLVLPHAYRHLSPLVDPTPSRAAGVEKGEQEGAHWAGASSTPSPNPFDLDGGFDGDAGVRP
jgi:hypothetical protein